MPKIREYKNSIQPNWCPGCGDFGIQLAIQEAVANRDIPFEKLALISGIGCSSRIGGYLYCYGAHTTHGRALPFAQGVKLANQDLEVIVCSGDGDAYAIGMAHTIHAIKRNVNITYIVFDNQVYGLTKGQTSPRSDHGFITKTTPHGNPENPLPVVSMAVAMGATFVAQEYAQRRKELVDIIEQAIAHKGFSFINVFTPCVTFNKQNTYEWYNTNLKPLSLFPGYDPTDQISAMKTLTETNSLATGLIYKNEQKKSFDEVTRLDGDLLVDGVQKPSKNLFEEFLQDFK